MPSVLDASALATLSNLKDLVGVASADTSKDYHLERCLNRATWVIEHLTGRKFNNGTSGGLKARRYNGNTATPPANVHGTTGVTDEDYLYFSGATKDQGGDTVIDERGYGLYYLPAYPVQANSIVTFVLATLADRSAGGETWDTTTLVEWVDYVVEREKGVLRFLGGRFATGFRNYRVTMAAGYQYGSAQPYVPPDLEALCIEIAKGLFRDNRTLQSESIGTWSRSYKANQEDPFVQETLSRYTRPVL